ncbi:MAG: hypothetical protein WC569_01415 [Candidatus Omnitrophota bacterium]
MEKMTSDELFISVVKRVNTYLIMMGVFFFIYFLLNTKVNIFLFLLALLSVAFALLSYKHTVITESMSFELRRAKAALADVSRETREMHEG